LEGILIGNLNPDILNIDLQKNDVILVNYSENTVSKASERSVFYLTPEQTGRFNQQVDLRADLFSLGVIFYEILTDQLPIKGKSRLE